ncbi:MAG: tRNA pseudouridine(55) synthase TruB [Acidobacteria bacterium]|nr:tRNA pseudouridine(55) synthase TruB [Acidobacteriota bacterium]
MSRTERPADVVGVLLIDKPSGLTSHDVVARLRRVLRTSRIGHAGTLDPLATGLLVVAVGPATRLLRFAQAETKRYLARVRFGAATDSLDADGVVIEETSDVLRSRDQVADAGQRFLGVTRQVPPMVSAVKVGGRRLHELARQGVEVERPEREITVTHFGVSATESPVEWDLDITCSSGTYVRVLAADLARELGTLGHLVALRRLASGVHDVANALTLTAVEESESPREHLLAADVLVQGLARVSLTEAQATAMRRGQRVTLESSDDGPLAAFDSAGALVGVLQSRRDYWQPDVVFSGAVS